MKTSRALPEPATINISNVILNEKDNGTSLAVFNVSLSRPEEKSIQVQFSTVDGTATAHTDYMPTSGILTFDSGETEQSISVVIQGDTSLEMDETFAMLLLNSTNAKLAKTKGNATIINDDFPPTVSIASRSVTEGNSSLTSIQFVLTLSQPAGIPIGIHYSTEDGTAQAGSDYIGSTGLIEFPTGSTQQTFSIDIIGDLNFELNEAFSIILSNPKNTVPPETKASCTILNDDNPPVLSLSNLSISEGDSGSKNAVFTARLSQASELPATVQFTTHDGTATSALDYSVVSGILSFPPYTTEQSIKVPVHGDLLFEPDETFTLKLSNASNASLPVSQVVGTILNDDAVPKITVADISVKEGNTGSATAVITINLTETAGSTVNVSFATKDISALAVSDYVATSGKISFSPGTSTQSISVQISSDTLFETDESFAINLSNPGNATILDSQSIVTILNDDLPPKIFVADRSINEGNSGTVNAVFVLTLSQASALPVSANFFTKDITATAGVDYAANSGTISFPAGTTTKSITLLVKGDDLFEKDETFSLNLASPTDASIADDQAIGTIVNDDAIPLITIADASFREGDAGTTTANISVTLSHPSAVITTVQYATADGSANSSSDYTAKSGTLMIPAGATAQNIVIELIGDIEFELNETFLINLLNPTNSAFGDSSATITILNDDSPPSVSISNASVTEGNSGNVSMTFPLSLSKIVQLPVSVQYKTSDGTAMAGIDYSSQSGTVTFPPGSQNQTVKVQIRPDTILETDETFFIDLSSPTNSTIANRQGVGTIIDDEPTIAMQTDFFTGEGQRINFLFVVDRSLTMDPIFSTVIDETENFIATLQQRRTVNWWAAVTVVDVRWLMEKNGENMLVTAGSTEVVKSTTTPDPINTLKENLLATQRYNTHERGLDAARFALEREGQKFMRPDVNLALIWATDEEDKSCYNWNFVGGFYRSDLCSDQKTGERSVDHSIFSDFFKSMTTKPLLYPMIEIPGNKCSGWESSVGTRYITVQGEVGTGRTLDVCDTKASYQTIANDISARGECYTLSRAASGNFFTVFVNGVSIVQGSNGFTFDPATNQICFAGSQVPIIGAKIKVNYQVK